MKNQIVKLQRNKGYVFNKVNKQLEKYEFISCSFNFATNIMHYKCRLGGVETMVNDTELKVYASESDFKEGTPLYPSDLKFDDVMRQAYGFTPEWNGDVPLAWEYKNGEAVLADISDITFLSSGTWLIEKDNTRQIYKSHLQVFNFHDLMIKEDDGSVTIRKSPASKLELNDEQKALIGEFQSVLQRLRTADVQIIFDENEVKLQAMPTRNIESFRYWGDYDSTYTQVDGMLMEIKGVDIVSYNSDNYGLYVTFKE